MSEFNYKIIKDFYQEHKSDLTTSECTMFEDYLKLFDEDSDNDDDGLPYVSPTKLPRFTYPEPLDYSDMKPKVTKDNSKPGDISDLSVDAIVVDIDVYPHTKITEAKPTNKKPSPIDIRLYPKKPTVRKRRKQWGGVKTYRTYELNAGKSMGYAMRSMKRHLPHIAPYSIKRATERMKRSIAHLYFKVEIEPIETQQKRMTLDLFDAYEQFAHYLFEIEQEDTSAKTDAWDTYIPSNALDDFIRDNYQPTMIAFSELPSLIRKFIAEEWTKYGIEAHEARQETYGYNLSQSQVKELQSSDKSFLKEMF